ncbi:MAG TPA: dTDP-4-dehydrorhamnose reductase [Coriobacteriia bacterium]
MPGPLLIAGAGGMLGHALQAVCLQRGWAFFAPVESEFDITSAQEVSRVVTSFAALHADGVLVNAAAYTNVERAEDDPETAFAVNRTGARLLAHAAARAGMPFVHVSTDFVFDGTKTGPYTEDDVPNPLSVYGVSKLTGERVVLAANPRALIVRTAWVFGPYGSNFPTKILERATGSIAITVVNDEVGSPTYTLDLAAGILDLADAGARGIYHLAGSGSCTRDEMAREILRLAGLEGVKVVPVPASSFPSTAPRPANSVLDCSKAAELGVTMPDWRDGLARFVAASR